MCYTHLNIRSYRPCIERLGLLSCSCCSLLFLGLVDLVADLLASHGVNPKAPIYIDKYGCKHI